MFVRIVMLCCLSVAATSVAIAADDPVVIGARLSMESKVLGEERPYWVHVPNSYEQGTQRYPVLYLLDGDAHFHSASGVMQFMSAGINSNTQIPEMIVVAIPNTDRTRDLTPTHTKIGFDGSEAAFLASSGGGEAFLTFLRDELFPAIESTYRTQPYRLLVGHSFGGLLAVHAFLNHPGMFQGTIAIDPSLWWEGGKLVDQTKELLEQSASVRRSIYVTLANNPATAPGEPKIMELAGRRFGMILDTLARPAIRSAIRYYDREDHGSVPLVSLYDGLLFTFDGFKPPLQAFMDDPAAVEPHYRKVSEQLGFEVLPSEALVNQLGYVLLMQEKVDRAIELFRMNVRNFPESSNVHDSLGEAYMTAGKHAEAIASYQKSIELDPTNDNAKTRLEELRSGAD